MSGTLPGSHALVISSNYGTETDELQKTVANLREAGVRVTVAAFEPKPIRTLAGDVEPGPQAQPDTTVDAVDASDFAALVVPGGTINADAVRANEHALRLARAFAAEGKVVAAICHGPWLLADADLLAGRTVTSYPTLQRDLVRSDAIWVDQEVVVDDSDGYTVITSRNPNDIPAFSAAIIERLR